MAVITYRDALNQALREEMQRDDRVFIMGEEVGVYQGAYKVSKGLLQEFGEMRVVDTPITELGFAGVGVGSAMVGLRPIIEFMTWNFAVLALDQVLNSAAKLLYMSGGQFNIPMVFRGPNGAALQLSAQHSQAFESWLAHMPGVKVVTPGTPYDAKGLLKSAIRDDNPVLVLEGEMLYNTKGEVPDEEYLIPIGKAELKREGDACSIITNGKMVLVAMQAADQLAKDGIKVVTPATPYDAKGLLKAAIRDDNPVCFLEGEMLYNTKGEVPEEEYVIPLGKAELKREGDHCSIITFGKMALVAMQVADQLAKEGIRVDVVDLRTVRPMDTEAIAESVRKTNRAVVLEEGWEIAGMGAQIVDYIQRDCFDHLDAPVVRVHQADVPMPYAKNLERAAKPDAAKTIAAVKKVMYLE
jgi:pyruvate dehydrogenase E1 component beta subunit